VINSSNEISKLNPMSTSLLKIWVPLWYKFELQFFSFKSNNVFVHFIDGLGYWNQQFIFIYIYLYLYLFIFFLHVHLCWCVCALWNSFWRMGWIVVKYLSTKIATYWFDKILNWGTFFTHSKPWSWTNPPYQIFVIKKKIDNLTKQNINIFK